MKNKVTLFYLLIFSAINLFTFHSINASVDKLLAVPTTQATNITFSNIQSTQVDISWTNGDGGARTVFVFAGNSGNASPVDNTTYNANTIFPTGDQIGVSGWYTVYNGAGNSVTVTGLTAGTEYRVMVTEYNGGGGSEEYLTTPDTGNPNNVVTTFTAPSTQASNILASNITTSQADISWTNGDGSARAVFVYLGNSGTATPDNNTTYTANTVFGAGTQIGVSGWYNVYNGVGTSVTVTGLASGTTYRVMVTEYNGTSGAEGYNTSSAANNPINITTQFSVPGTQASNIVFSNVTTTTTDISWTNGNGTSRAVFMYLGNSGSAAPVANTTYTANTTFGSGTQIGASGWYCIYNGVGTSVSVTGLTTNTTYRVMVTEYNGGAGAEAYNTSSAANNPLNVLTKLNPPSLVSPTNNSEGIGPSGITLTWTAVTGATHYRLTVSGIGGSPFTIAAPTVSYALPPLTAGTNYTWFVEASNDGGSTWSLPSTTWNFYTNFLSSIANPSQGNYAVGISVLPTFTWFTDTGGATSYELQVSTSPGFGSLVTLASSTTIGGLSYSVLDYQSLNSGVLYYWRVKVNGGTNNGKYSATWEFTTAIGQVTISSYYNSGTSAYLAWYFLPSVSGLKYDIYYSADPTFATGVSTVLNLSVTSYTLTSLSPGVTYYARISAKNNAGTVVFNFSTSVFFTVPGLPTPYLSYPIGGGTTYSNPPYLYWYTGAWDLTVEYEVAYWISSSSDPSGGGYVAQSATSGYFETNSPNLYTLLSATLTPGATYFWKVRTKSGTSFSTWSTTESFVIYSSVPTVAPTPYPSWPTGGNTSYINPPTFYWYTGTLTTGLYFQVQWSNDNFSTVLGTASDIPNLYYTLGSALPANTYYWRVRSKVGLGGSYGSWSTIETFVIPSTVSIVSVPYPTNPIGITVPTLNPTLSWYAFTPPALEYRVRISPYSSTDGSGMLNHPTATSSGWISSTTSSYNSLTFAPPLALVAGASYYWQVQSRLAAPPNTVSSWSYVASFQTAAGALSIVPMVVSPIQGQPINNTSAVLSWATPTESRTHLKYDLEYSKSESFENAVKIKDLNEPFMKIDGLEQNAKYYWRVNSKNNTGDVSNFSETGSFKTSGTTSVEEDEVVPTAYSLEQNYPNPFNPTTRISYSIPENSFVTLKVYDIMGREVKTLVNQNMNSGKHFAEWKGDDNFGNKVVSGTYIYRITTNKFTSVKKMLLIK